MDDAAPRPFAVLDQNAAGRAGCPLVVDLDGSLVSTDTLLECILALTWRPAGLFRGLWALRHGRARLKEVLAAAADLDPALLPYNRELLAYLRDERARGRFLVLATGADRRTAAAVAAHLGCFDLVLASDGCTNLSAHAKLAAIRASLGDQPFSYIGNSRKDLAVWREAASGICVNARPWVARAAARVTVIERSFVGRGWPSVLWQALLHRRP